MSKQSVWSKAAKLIAEGEHTYACSTLDSIDEVRPFIKWFCPKPFLVNWFGPFTPQNQLARTLALLFMEQIERDERE